MKTSEERFWEKVLKTDGCWLWQGARDVAGYGKVRVNMVMKYAHRFSREMACGAVPSGLVVMHKCDNPSCVNPAHLTTGTPKQNSDDKMAKGRYATSIGIGSRSPRKTKTQCRRGHPWILENLKPIKGRGYSCKTCEREADARRRALLK